MISLSRTLFKSLINIAIIGFISGSANADSQNGSDPTRQNRDSELRLNSGTNLEPWVSWVQERHPEWQCAKNEDDFICSWPGRMSYTLRSDGADFTFDVQMSKSGVVNLPSAAGFFPHSLKFSDDKGNEVTSFVSAKDGLVSVKLPKGIFKITGKLSWSVIPPEIPLPSSVGIVELSFDPVIAGKWVAKRVGDSLLLEEPQKQERQQDSIGLSVIRRITDSSPLEIETILRLRASGRSRLLQFGKILPANSTPVSIDSPVPFQLKADGDLSIQLSASEFDVHIRSLLPQPVTEISLPKPIVVEWPTEEIWSWNPDDRFRSVEFTGGEPVHNDLKILPTEWKGDAAFILKPGASAKLNELRRGEQLAPPDSIEVDREIWMDLNGDGLTIADDLRGTLQRGTRVNALSENLIGRASLYNEPILVSKDPDKGLSGVELRDQGIELSTVARVDGSKTISAAGWDIVASRVAGVLNLPPSWKLITIIGATNVTGAWFDSWTLLDLFLGILIVLSAHKLMGKWVAGAAFVSVLLNHLEFLAPQMLFIHLLIITVIRMIVGERPIWSTLLRGLQVLTFAVWGLQILAFAKLQFTQFLFPQLQAGTRYRTVLQDIIASIDSYFLTWPLLLLIAAFIILALMWIFKATSWKGKIGRTILAGILALIAIPALIAPLMIGLVTSHSSYEGQQYPRSQAIGGDASYSAVAPASKRKELNIMQEMQGEQYEDKKINVYGNKALVAGPATPTWNWRQHHFAVIGPVTPEAQMRIVVLTPTWTRLFSLLRALGMLWFLILVGKKLQLKLPNPSSAYANGAALILLLVCSTYSNKSEAQFPSQEILNELEQRLEQKRCHDPVCASIIESGITIHERDLTLSLKISSDGVSSITLPGPVNIFAPSSFVVNGKPSVAIRGEADGFLRVQTEPGISTIEIKGALPTTDSFSLQFPQTPLYTHLSTSGWTSQGVSASGQVEGNIRFTRLSEEKKTINETVRSEISLPSWAVVERHISLGARIATNVVVRRLGQTDSSFRAVIPLAENEQVTTGAFNIEGRNVVVVFEPGSSEKFFTTDRPFVESLLVKAVPSPMMSEKWFLDCNPILSCSWKGLLPTQSKTNGHMEPEWNPFPGEEVTILSKPLHAIAGEPVAVDSVEHSVEWGVSSLAGTVNVIVRAAQQTPIRVIVPKEMQLESVQLDNTQIGASSDAPIVLTPGQHNIVVRYQGGYAAAFVTKVPEISLDTNSNNVTVKSTPPPSRWVVWLNGPLWGPSVVYWAKLILLVVIFYGLAVYGFFPFGKIQAVLLAIGLSTLPIIQLMIPTVWLVVMQFMKYPSRWIEERSVGLRRTVLVILSLFALLFLYRVVQLGLVLEPPMLIVGNGSSEYSYRWFMDHVENALPTPSIISLPMWCWRVFALGWSTWLVFALLGWLKMVIELLREARPEPSL